MTLCSFPHTASIEQIVQYTNASNSSLHVFMRMEIKGLCVHGWAVSCISHLSQVNLVQHDDGSAAVVIYQSPEVFDCVGQWMLGHNEGSRLPVALHNTQYHVLHNTLFRKPNQNKKKNLSQDDRRVYDHAKNTATKNEKRLCVCVM